MHDDQIREQFTRWAQPLTAAPPPAVAVLRRRARRRTAVRAAVSGLAVIGAAAVVALSGFPRTGQAAPAVAPAPGAPPYAVILERGGQDASVLDLGTGKSLGAVAGPAAHSDFQWVAAASDDRTFVLASQSQAAVTRFYRLHLAASGAPGRLTPLKVPPLHGSQIYGLALTADAGQLAVAWQNDPNGPVRSHVSVTALATGATRTWTAASGGAGAVSWAGDRTVAFDWQDADQDARSGVRLLDTAVPGTSLLATRLLIPASTRAGAFASPGDPLITQDGSTVLVTMGSGTRTVIARFSAGSGKLRAVLTPAAGQSQWYCGILWADPLGRHLLTQCGTTQGSIEGGRYTQIRLPRLIPASETGYANTFAW